MANVALFALQWRRHVPGRGHDPGQRVCLHQLQSPGLSTLLLLMNGSCGLCATFCREMAVFIQWVLSGCISFKTEWCVFLRNKTFIVKLIIKTESLERLPLNLDLNHRINVMPRIFGICYYYWISNFPFKIYELLRS